jgi:hypothetical protein
MFPGTARLERMRGAAQQRVRRSGLLGRAGARTHDPRIMRTEPQNPCATWPTSRRPTSSRAWTGPSQPCCGPCRARGPVRRPRDTRAITCSRPGGLARGVQRLVGGESRESRGEHRLVAPALSSPEPAEDPRPRRASSCGGASHAHAAIRSDLPMGVPGGWMARWGPDGRSAPEPQPV